MTKDQIAVFQNALQAAQQRRNELIHQRSVVEHELAQQSRAIAALAELLGETTGDDIGLTGATLLIVRTSKQPLAPTEVRDELKKIGFDIDGFSNPMASLHQVLKRLEDKKEIEEFSGPDGKKRYRARTDDPFAELMRSASKAAMAQANTLLEKVTLTSLGDLGKEMELPAGKLKVKF